MYPRPHWPERHDRDLLRFRKDGIELQVPRIPYLYPRASVDVLALARNPNSEKMSDEGMWRALKFATRSCTDPPTKVSKGQRCTTVIVASVQASIIQPLLKDDVKKYQSFKKYKNQPFLSYCDEYFLPAW